VAALAARAHAVVGIGTTGPSVVAAVAAAGGAGTVVARRMDEAVATAARMVPPGGVVLLSPAFSSLDEYASFAARGDAFRDAARALQAAGTT
jgi:UDP-N-acetylmuramoylalanine-D-glutamate ligase